MVAHGLLSRLFDVPSGPLSSDILIGFAVNSHKYVNVRGCIFTARIRRMTEGNSFSLFTLARWGYPISGLDLGGGNPIPGPDGGYLIPGPDGGGYPILLMGGTPSKIRMGGTWDGVPHSRLDGSTPLDGSYPIQDWMGYPCPRLDGVPPPISKASTCYAVGGVPLAFTQEDFLVFNV